MKYANQQPVRKAVVDLPPTNFISLARRKVGELKNERLEPSAAIAPVVERTLGKEALTAVLFYFPVFFRLYSDTTEPRFLGARQKCLANF